MNDNYNSASSDTSDYQKIEKRDFTPDYSPAPQQYPLINKEDFTANVAPEPPKANND